MNLIYVLCITYLYRDHATGTVGISFRDKLLNGRLYSGWGMTREGRLLKLEAKHKLRTP